LDSNIHKGIPLLPTGTAVMVDLQDSGFSTYVLMSNFS